MAHGLCGYVCIILALGFFSTYQQTSAEIGYLLPKDNLVDKSFRPHGDPSQWRSVPIRPDVHVYSICNSEDWLQSVKKFNTKGIHELTVNIVYKYYNKDSSKKALNRTAFFLGVLPKITPADGVLNEDMTNATSTELLLVQNDEQNILIKPKDTNNCMMVYAVNITYRFCNKTTILDVAEFPKTFAPRNGSAPLMVEGTCIIHGSKKPVAYCDSNGEWTINETKQCSCARGQIMTSKGCIELSSMIQNAKAFRLSNTRAVIWWEQTTALEVYYKVICKMCNSTNCNQTCPKSVRFKENNTSISNRNSSYITGLERGREYLFIILGKIETIDENHWRETSKRVQLRALPEEVKNLTVTSYNHDRVVLTWFPPSNVEVTSVIYDVACRVEDQPRITNRCKKLKYIPSHQQLLQTNVTITGFRNEGIQYVFEVRAKYSFYPSSQIDLSVEWNFASINYTADSKEPIPTVSKSFNVVDIVIGVSVLFFAVMITIVATRFYNRWKRRKQMLKFDGENSEHLTHCEVSLTDITTHYIDPSNYDSVENVLRKFTRKLNEKRLKTDTIIGEGEFGVVWKAYLDMDGKERTVAVKCLRSGLSEKLRRDFLAEASVMGQFKDPNVISLYGVVVKKNTVKIVMEFMSNGSLNKYLEKNNGGLTILQLLGMARGIASGMNYLSGRNFIHRDLAARNILVDENLTCKVSDFGLTREICQTSNYEARGGKIPIRWTAPEVTMHGKSFISSDVWSYGVVLWEIMSFGQRPYWEWDNFRVLREIESGYRLPAPLKCPKAVHCLMLHCWEKERSDRPTFQHILEKLDEWIRSPETIHHSPVTKARRPKMEDIGGQSLINEWLDSIKMGKYAPNFSEAGYNRLSQIVNLTEQDLIDIGITLVGHRHKIHQSIPLVTSTS